MSKMNYKLVLIVAMITASVTTNSVVAQAKKATTKKTTVTKPAAETGPTKEETIAWLMEKMKLYARCYSFNSDKNYNAETNFELTINECEVVFHVQGHGDITCHNPLIDMKFMVDANAGISSVDGDNVYQSMFSYSYSAIYYKGGNATKSKYQTSDDVWFYGDEEPDLIPRMRKAFAHLATFCQEKKEKF